MPTYAVLWEKGTKHDFKSLGRQAAEQIRAAVETKLVHDPRQGKQLQGDFSPVIELGHIASSTPSPRQNWSYGL